MAFLLRGELTAERVSIQPAAWVEVRGAIEAEAPGVIAVAAPGAMEAAALDEIAAEEPGVVEVEALDEIAAEAPGVIEAQGAVAVDFEDELRFVGLVQVCSAVQGEPGVGAVAGQDGLGAVAGQAGPAVAPVWLLVEWV